MAITDSEEGLILVNNEIVTDFEPRNNFIERALTWNPHGILDGANYATFAGHLLYVSATAGVVIVDLDDPMEAEVLAKVALDNPRGAMVQLRYLFVVDDDGLKVVQLTSPELNPKFYGFSPAPNPKPIAWRKLVDPALSVSRDLERDRAVDETSHQIAVLGRLGSRPFNLEEMRRLSMTGEGGVWTVAD